MFFPPLCCVTPLSMNNQIFLALRLAANLTDPHPFVFSYKYAVIDITTPLWK